MKPTRIVILAMILAVFGSAVPQFELNMGSAALAAERKEKPQTRKSEVLGKAAFAKIEESQTLLSEGKHQAALDVLQTIIDSTKFKPYEKAVAIQTMGYVFADKGDYEKTIATFQRAINTGDLPPRIVSDLTYNLAQLNLAEDNPKRRLSFSTNGLTSSRANHQQTLLAC